MENEEISLILEKQRLFFQNGGTQDVKVRLQNLKKLKALIIQFEPEIVKSLWTDFHKPEFEVIATETRLVISEINFLIKNLKKWSGPKRVRTPLVHFLSHSYILPQPYGQVLILSPWNFPFQLAFVPLAGALAAGNCVILKPSQQVPETVKVMQKILGLMPPEIVSVIDGDHSTSDYLLSQRFDYIFFTGSPKVGKYVMKMASENLTPVSLELGGKSPCIVLSDADLKFAARRIAWGKFINCGQICVSPDYLIVDKRVKLKLIELLKQEIKTFYGEDPELSPDYARVISGESVKRLAGIVSGGAFEAGGKSDVNTSYFAPTIMNNVTLGDPVMGMEIFGPILPVLEFSEVDEIFPIIDANPKPLALYIFSENRKLVRDILRKTQSGSVSINDTIMQFASHYLPFGGVGTSGMGRYHGKKSFETFSNMRSVLSKSNLLDVWLRYPPYTKFKTKIVSFLMSH
jgi:aldehyde dehydrogenase (NAD+)